MSTVIVFDVNETLSDLSPLAARFVAVGAPASAASLWFTSVLRDGFALSLAGVRPDFAEVAREALTARLSVTSLDDPLDHAVEHVLGGLHELPVHPDVATGVHDLAAAGFRLVTLSNGGTGLAEKLLGDAGLLDHFERLLSVDDAPAWKPAPQAYQYAAGVCGVQPEDMVLVASHPWDVDGAIRAGLDAVWVDRHEGHYPSTFSSPTYTVAGLDAIHQVLS
jgi:2-haloacid dehalogenase